MEKSTRGSLSLRRGQGLLLFKGIILGMGIIVPGISGGTILIAFGIYERIINDFLIFHLTPYVTMGLGAVIGVFGGSYLISYLFEFYRNPTSAFILGCLLMSIPFILKKTRGYSPTNLGLFIVGGVISFVIAGLPMLFGVAALTAGQLFLAGFIAGTTMIIPGVSGSAVLIILGIYEEMLIIINELQILNLLIFAAGALLAIAILAKLIKTLFTTHGSQILFFFSGMILGSARMLIPDQFNLLTIAALLFGIFIVYKWGNFKYKQSRPILARTFNVMIKRIRKR